MKSPKERNLEKKILEKLKHCPKCIELVQYLFDDFELQIMQDYANTVSIKRLGYNDHGPVHMRQVTNNSIKMLNILHSAGIKTSLEQEDIGSFEDSMSAVIIASMLHDLGMMIGRESHEKMSAILAQPMIEKVLNLFYPDNIQKRTIIKSLALESIVGHMGTHKIHSLEAGIILVADGCDMTKGRARIPLAINHTPRVGDIHKYSASAIQRVSIKQGERKPIKIIVEMSTEVGLFQIEEVLLGKVNSSTAKQYIEIYAGVKGQEEYKCYL